MRILIGGSPSTGSSVFRQILNRHPNVFCGPETNLFCFPELYQNWNKARRRILFHAMMGLRNTDVRIIRGVHLEDKEFGWTLQEVKKLIAIHQSFPLFCDTFFAKPLSRNGKEHWAEKTPANVLQFPAFMKSFEDAYIIHTTRCPYDTVASLVSRGMSTYQAASIYLYYTAHGLSSRHMPGYLEARYESLVKDAAATWTSEILDPLGLLFNSEMLAEGNPEMSGITQMQGWQLDELARVSDQSVSRYHKCAEEVQVHIATALASVRFIETYAKKHQMRYDTIEKVCAELNYHFHNEPDRIDRSLFPVLQKQRHQVMRELWLTRLLSSSVYPIELF